MTRLPAAAALVALVFATAGCDRTESLLLTPELEEETSFESGLDGWFVDRQAGSLGTASVVTGAASEGERYLQLDLVASTDQVWAEKAFTLAPNTTYSVTIMADVRAVDGSAEIVVAARGVDPDGSGFVSAGAAAGEWTRVLSPQPVTTDAQGRAWVALGARSSGGAASIGIDLLGASFLRSGGS